MFVEDYERLSDENERLKKELELAKASSLALVRAIAKLPERWYLQCAVEPDTEDTPFDEEEGERFLTAVLMEKAPPGGWTIPTYFNEPPGVKRSHTEAWLEPYRYKDVARVAVSTEMADFEAFNGLIIRMIEERFKP